MSGDARPMYWIRNFRMVGIIPKWNPRSRLGVHLGRSPQHASTVPLILNPASGCISPQYHVVYNDWFSSVSTDEKGPEEFDMSTRTSFFLDNKYLAEFDENEDALLDDVTKRKQNNTVRGPLYRG